jgi:peroxiredoxin
VQLRELVQFHEVTEVGYAQVAAISKDPPEVLAALRNGLNAPFPFLSDAELRLTDALGIRETTDRRHGPLPVPFTFALLPDLTLHRLFNGWYMAGRPTPEELRQTLRDLLRASNPDFDFAGE